MVPEMCYNSNCLGHEQVAIFCYLQQYTNGAKRPLSPGKIAKHGLDNHSDNGRFASEGTMAIYFISVNGEYVKIGHAKKPKSRLVDLQVSSPYDLTLLGAIDGSVDDEKELHRKFLHLHKRGEWFKLEAELIRFIESCNESGNEQPGKTRRRQRWPNQRICAASDCNNPFKVYAAHELAACKKVYCSEQCGGRERQRKYRARVEAAQSREMSEK